MSPPPQRNTHILPSFSVSTGEQNTVCLCPQRKQCTDCIICLLLHSGSSKTLMVYFPWSLWGKMLTSQQHSSDQKILDVQGKPTMQVAVYETHSKKGPQQTMRSYYRCPKWNKMFSLQAWVLNSRIIVSHKHLKPARHCLGLIYYTQAGIWIPDSHFSSIQQTQILEAAGAEYSLR